LSLLWYDFGHRETPNDETGLDAVLGLLTKDIFNCSIARFLWLSLLWYDFGHRETPNDETGLDAVLGLLTQDIFFTRVADRGYICTLSVIIACGAPKASNLPDLRKRRDRSDEGGVSINCSIPPTPTMHRTPTKKARSMSPAAATTSVRRSPRTSSKLRQFLDQYTKDTGPRQSGNLYLDYSRFEEAIKALLELLKDSMAEEQIGIQYEVVDEIMKEIEHLTEFADPQSVRATQMNIRRWEWKQLQIQNSLDEKVHKRIHTYAGAVSAVFAAKVMRKHGVPVNHYSVGEPPSLYQYKDNSGTEDFHFTFSDICTLGWFLTVALRYHTGNPARYFDIEERATEISKTHMGQHELKSMMEQWREDMNAQVEMLPVDTQFAVHMILDQFALGTNDSRRSLISHREYILAHGGRMREGKWVVRPSQYWANAFKVGTRSLSKIDDKYHTSFAAAAKQFWETGSISVRQFAMRSRRCYFGRTIPLWVLTNESLGSDTELLILEIWKCPTVFWTKYHCTGIAFSNIDSLFVGYTYTDKSLASHVPQGAGGAGAADHVSDRFQSSSQPSPSMISSVSQQSHAYQLDLTSVKIPENTRATLVADRRQFMKWIGGLVQSHIDQKGVQATLAVSEY
jgi:hypothetical protein